VIATTFLSVVYISFKLKKGLSMTRRHGNVPGSQPGNNAPQSEVELPDGTVIPLDAKSNEELTQLAAQVIGVDPGQLSVLDEEGNVQPPASPTPKQAKVIATPEFGGYINFRELKIDQISSLDSFSYSGGFRLSLLEPNKQNPFRVWLELDGKWYSARVTLNEYPFYSGSWPSVKFEQLLPPCPKHPGNRHPNVSDIGNVCFGNTRVLPDTRIVGLLNTLDSLLHNPNHGHGFGGSCRVSA
jgi:hypothetical protein